MTGKRGEREERAKKGNFRAQKTNAAKKKKMKKGFKG